MGITIGSRQKGPFHHFNSIVDTMDTTVTQPHRYNDDSVLARPKKEFHQIFKTADITRDSVSLVNPSIAAELLFDLISSFGGLVREVVERGDGEVPSVGYRERRRNKTQNFLAHTSRVVDKHDTTK